ncbi:hypothetical protein ACVJBD_001018 [Rhizobium mongolense]
MTIFVALAADMPVASATLIITPNLTRNGASYALVGMSLRTPITAGRVMPAR